MKLVKSTVAAFAMIVAAPVSASVLIDGSPTGPEAGIWSNNSAGQNFLVKFSLASASNLTGFDIFTMSQFVQLGRDVQIKIRADDNGSPTTANLFSFTDTIDVTTPFSNDQVIAGSNFSSIALGAGTYWIGMSGLASELAWSSFNNGGPTSNPNQRQLAGDSVTITPNINDLAFRIRSEAVGAVPEPATWLMLMIGFGAIGASLRHRRRQPTVQFA